jgi:predicted nucleic acid-binding protein
VPAYGTWLRATRIIAALRADGGRVLLRRAGFFNDCLLAATARETGHAIVTHNRRDFALIAKVEPGLEVLSPLP